MDNINVSVIVPCYNHGCYLADSLGSLLAQTYPYFECIIVNDGSSDNTIEAAEEFTRKDSRFKLLNIENGGLSNARNTGIKAATGDLILPLDADDKIDPTYIEKAVRVLADNPDIDIVYCDAQLFGKKNNKWILPEYSLELILGQNCIFCSAIYRRSSYMRTNGYNVNMRGGYEDWDFWLSMIEKGSKVHKINECLFHYRIRSLSMARSMSKEDKSRLRKQIYLNHKELYNSHFFNPLCSFEYVEVAESLEYKVGKILLRPLRAIARLIRK